jgi:taurine dioxygenase
VHRDFVIRPMHGAFGAVVEGVDLARPAGRATFQAIQSALYRHKVLVLPKQQLAPSEYLAFGRLWGAPIVFFNPRERDGANPELIVISNAASTPQDRRDVALHWHVDGSYESPPASTTLLYAVEAPDDRNETLFCDMAAAYAALSSDMKARIAGLVVEHGIGDRRLLIDGEWRGRSDAASRPPPVQHPLVRTHPVTGAPTLYAPSGSPFGIRDMAQAEAIDLLIALKRHALQPRFMQRARAAANSILIWDNYAVMHSATPTEYSDEEGKRRLIHRYSTRAIPDLAIAGVTPSSTPPSFAAQGSPPLG